MTLKDFGLVDKRFGPTVGCVINSTLFYSWFITYGNGRNVAIRDIVTFPAPSSLFEDESGNECRRTFAKLMTDYKSNSVVRTRRDGVEFQEFYPSQSKLVLDGIDLVLARHYGFSEDELDFIINYDIKYRMGADADGEEEG